MAHSCQSPVSLFTLHHALYWFRFGVGSGYQHQERQAKREFFNFQAEFLLLTTGEDIFRSIRKAEIPVIMVQEWLFCYCFAIQQYLTAFRQWNNMNCAVVFVLNHSVIFLHTVKKMWSLRLITRVKVGLESKGINRSPRGQGRGR